MQVSCILYSPSIMLCLGSMEGHSIVIEKGLKVLNYKGIQMNFYGSNTFGTMKRFETGAVRVNEC